MAKFFIPKQNISDNKIIIDSEDAKHIARVLRAKEGDILTACDSVGTDYEAKINKIEKSRIICDILSAKKSDTEPNVKVTLFQGIPKAAKMDYIIQKTTELGIVRIVPVELSRCVAKVKDEKKTERWNKISKEAAKQSGRGIIPEVSEPVSLKEAVEEMKKNDIYFVPYECDRQHTLKEVLLSKSGCKTAAFMIGPEGGFAPEETEYILKSQIPTVTLGRRILRTETAGEAVLAMMMYEIGDVNHV